MEFILDEIATEVNRLFSLGFTREAISIGVGVAQFKQIMVEDLDQKWLSFDWCWKLNGVRIIQLPAAKDLEILVNSKAIKKRR